MTPLVSVCVTTYNHEAYLATALDAILAQRCDFGVEIVLGEDCSSDKTLSICREYADKYPENITLIASTENVGWRANYRRCVEAARGKYIGVTKIALPSRWHLWSKIPISGSATPSPSAGTKRARSLATSQQKRGTPLSMTCCTIGASRIAQLWLAEI